MEPHHIARREPRILNEARQVQRRDAAAVRGRANTIWDFGCAASASPVQLRAFDRAIGDLHEAVGAANHSIYGDPAPRRVQRLATDARDEAGDGRDGVRAVPEERLGEPHEEAAGSLETEPEEDAAGAATAPASGQAEAAQDEDAEAEPLVQQRAGRGEDPRRVQAAAAHGLRGSGGAVPHRAAVQRAFGAHDVSGVRAVVGGAGADACDAMGAEAYASGDNVVFRGAPSLHTVAHELTHVIQQRRGIALKGGVGEVGDRYEREADAVAARVVRGEDVAPMLDRIAGGARSAGPAHGVQRAPARPNKAQLDAKVARAVALVESWLGRKLASPEKEQVAREVYGHPTAPADAAARTVAPRLKHAPRASSSPAARPPAARPPTARPPSAAQLKARVGEVAGIAAGWLGRRLVKTEMDLVAREVYGHPQRPAKATATAVCALIRSRPAPAKVAARAPARAPAKVGPKATAGKAQSNAELSREQGGQVRFLSVSRKDKVVGGQHGTEYEVKAQGGATVFTAPLAPGVSFKVDVEAAAGIKWEVAPGRKADITLPLAVKATPHLFAGLDGVAGVIVGGELSVEMVLRWRGFKNPPVDLDSVVVKGRPLVKAFFDTTGASKAAALRGSPLGREAKEWLYENASDPRAKAGVVWEWSPTGDIELARFQGGRWTFPIAGQIAGFVDALKGIRNKHQPLVDANQRKARFVDNWRARHRFEWNDQRAYWTSFSQWYARDADFRAAWNASGG